MDQNLAIALVAAVVVVTALAIKLKPDIVQAYFFEPLEQGRLLGAAIIAIVLIWTWVMSGVGWKVVTALLLVAFATAFFLIEEPHRDVR